MCWCYDKKSKKWTAVVVVLFMSLLFLSACGSRDLESMSGEVVAAYPGKEEGEFSLRIYTEKGSYHNLFLTNRTVLMTWPEGNAKASFRTSPPVGSDVSVFYAKSKKRMELADRITIEGYQAESIYINEAPVAEDEIMLSDGTPIDVWRGFRYTTYRLEDGTWLVKEDVPAGPENVHSSAAESLGDLKQEAQEKIMTYYEEIGLQYDLKEELELAYADYLEMEAPQYYGNVSLSQKIIPTFSNDRIIQFSTVVRKPVNGRMQEVQTGTVFDRETGDVMDGWELFSCSKEEAAQVILESAFGSLKNEDEEIRREMAAEFKPEYMVMYPDHIDVMFPSGSLESTDETHILLVEYTEDVRGIFHDWVIPVPEES